MIRNDLKNEYFVWLQYLVCGDMYPEQISYTKLLAYLHEKTFRFSIPKDKNRAEDGVGLRYRFACDNCPIDVIDDIYSYIDDPCSVLEMMIALAIRCEETIMDDPQYGDRTRQWFWKMIANLGLGSMSDIRFDRLYVDEAIERLLERDYEPDGRGGLFRIRGCTCDMRHAEIWHQLCWYLDSITDY